MLQAEVVCWTLRLRTRRCGGEAGGVACTPAHTHMSHPLQHQGTANVIAPPARLLVLLLSSNSQLSRHHCSRRLETWSRTVHFLALISWQVWKTTRLNRPLRLAATTGIPPPTLLGPLNGRLPACMRSMERLCKRLRKGFVLSSVMRLSTAFLQARRC